MNFDARLGALPIVGRFFSGGKASPPKPKKIELPDPDAERFPQLKFSRTLLLYQTTMYPLWWYTSWEYSAALHDPFEGRAVVGLACLSLYGLTYTHDFFKRNAHAMMVLGSFCITAHYMNVVHLNELSAMRIFGLFQIISALFVSLLTLKGVVAYGAFIITMGVWLAQTPSTFPGKVLPPAFLLITVLMYLSLRVRVRLIDSLTKSRKDIKSILDNVPAGFLAIDRDGSILPGYSRETEKLLSASLQGKSFAESIGLRTSAQKESFQGWVKMCFEGLLDFAEIRSLAPRESLAQENRFVELEFHPIYAETVGEQKPQARTLERLICVATDRTKERALEAEITRQQSRILAISRVLERRNDFVEVVAMIREFVSQPPADRTVLLRALHTMKGAVAIFHLQELGSEIHHLESQIKEEGRVPSHFTQLETILGHFLKEHESLIGRFDGSTSLRRVLEVDQCAEMIRRTGKLAGKSSPLFQSFLAELWLDPVHSAFEKFKESAIVLAERQGKMLEFQITPSDISVHLSCYRELSGAFVHLVRNAVDHGVEDPETRIAQGKRETGTIKVSFERAQAAGRFKVHLEDDGAGIDLVRIREVAVKRGVLTEADAKALSDADALQLIFRPGFSSRDEVTELSGRGVGLDALKYEVEKLQGTISVHTTVAKGTRFTLEVPILLGLEELGLSEKDATDLPKAA